MNSEAEESLDIDLIDIAVILLSIAAVANIGMAIAILCVPAYLVQHYGRRFAGFRTFIEKRVQNLALQEIIAPAPLVSESAPVKEDTLLTVKRETKPLVVPDKIKEQDSAPFWKGINDPAPTQKVTDKEALIKRIPEKISFEKIPAPHTKLAIPIGYGVNQDGQFGWIWGDFGSATIHGLIAGQSGTGKDTLLKLWFVALTRNNGPSEVKFVVLDGKGEWVIQPLINAQHMLHPPVGGINMISRKDKNGKVEWYDRANDDISEALSSLFEEINRRTILFKKHSVANIERYREKTGMPLPYVIIFATDVGSNAKELEMLLNILVSKGRSLGIRLVISMQTTSGQSTTWRSNLSLTISGNVQLESQDTPVLGIPVDEMFYRPSKLPHPKKRPGIFVMRAGDEQAIVQVPYIPDDVWETYIAKVLPQKEEIRSLEDELLRPSKAMRLLP